MSGRPAGPGRLRGRTVVITGAARGIGAALALRLAREGARIAAVGLGPTIFPPPQPGAPATPG
jgi:hypothetical protein